MDFDIDKAYYGFMATATGIIFALVASIAGFF